MTHPETNNPHDERDELALEQERLALLALELESPVTTGEEQTRQTSKYNPYHDRLGRFTSGNSAATTVPSSERERRQMNTGGGGGGGGGFPTTPQQLFQTISQNGLSPRLAAQAVAMAQMNGLFSGGGQGSSAAPNPPAAQVAVTAPKPAPPAPPTPAPTAAPAPAAAAAAKPATASNAPAGTKEVTDAVTLNPRSAKHQADFDLVMGEIAKVHRVPDNMSVKMSIISKADKDIGAAGDYNPTTKEMRAQKQGATHVPIGASMHEFGHALDNAIQNKIGGAPHWFASGAPQGSPVAGILKAIDSTGTIKRLEQHQAQKPDQYKQYLLTPQEKFARAYMQYIAAETKHPYLRGTVERYSSGKDAYTSQQWPDKEFAPIQAAFTQYLQAAGLKK